MDAGCLSAALMGIWFLPMTWRSVWRRDLMATSLMAENVKKGQEEFLLVWCHYNFSRRFEFPLLLVHSGTVCDVSVGVDERI